MSKTKRGRGPEPDRVRIEGDPERASDKLFQPLSRDKPPKKRAKKRAK